VKVKLSLAASVYLDLSNFVHSTWISSQRSSGPSLPQGK